MRRVHNPILFSDCRVCRVMQASMCFLQQLQHTEDALGIIILGHKNEQFVHNTAFRSTMLARGYCVPCLVTTGGLMRRQGSRYRPEAREAVLLQARHVDVRPERRKDSRTRQLPGHLSGATQVHSRTLSGSGSQSRQACGARRTADEAKALGLEHGICKGWTLAEDILAIVATVLSPQEREPAAGRWKMPGMKDED